MEDPNNTCDVTFMCIDGEVAAHSSVLKSKSEMFKAMFGGEFKKETRIDVKTYSIRTVIEFRKFIYGDKLSIDNYAIKNVYDLYRLFDQFMITDLASTFETELIKLAKNPWSTYAFLILVDEHMQGTQLGERIEATALDSIYKFARWNGTIFVPEDESSVPERILQKVQDYILERC